MITIIRSAVGSLSAVGFLKYLKEQGFRLVGTDIADLSVGKYFVDKFYTIPKATERRRVIDAYIKIVRKENAKWIISGPEEEISILAKEKGRFARLGAELLHPPYETLKVITDKLSAFNYFSSRKIQMPQTCALKDIRMLKGRIILKPRTGRGSNDIFLSHVDKASALEDIFSNRKYIAQEFIDGEEFTVDLLCGLDGRVLSVVPRRRVKIDSGISVIAETVKDKNLFDITLRIISRIQFVGANCFQFIKSKDGNYYLTDINPRFGGGALLSLRASKSFRENLINLLKGKHGLLSRRPFDFKIMRMCRFYDERFEY